MEVKLEFINEAFLENIFSKFIYKNIRLGILLAVDSLIIVTSYYFAYVLRLDSINLIGYQSIFKKTLPILIGIHLSVFVYTGMYKQVWRFANFHSAILIFKSTFFAILLTVIAMFFIDQAKMPPRSIPFIFWTISTMAITSIRFGWRALTSFKAQKEKTTYSRCLIYGAGSAGELLARYMTATPSFQYHLIGFIDDNPNKKGRILHGKKILGNGNDLVKLAKEHRITTVLIAMHTAPGAIVRSIVSKCQGAGIKPLIMPEISSSMSLDTDVKPRPIDVKDLLRRSPRSIDRGAVNNFFQNSVVLVTGAGGSIGSEVSRQIFEASPTTIILMDSSEYNLYRIELELTERHKNNVKIVTALGSVTDSKFVDYIFQTYNPGYVLHAAAYKHVPLVEDNPMNGIINNVLGTVVIAESSLKYGVKNFLLISSDKAVRPTSIMGQTKRLCEIYIQALQKLHQNQIKFCAVRFGNVLGSSGSVIPRFVEQIQNGGPVTVTHPNVTRYFMLTSEAVGLVLQSITMSNGGEIFVLNMGDPVNIYEMAKQLIILAGKEPDKDIKITFTGLRPGEKLYEELILDGVEEHTQHEDVFMMKYNNINAELTINVVQKVLQNSIAYEKEDALKLLKYISSDIFGSETNGQKSQHMFDEFLH